VLKLIAFKNGGTAENIVCIMAHDGAMIIYKFHDLG